MTPFVRKRIESPDRKPAYMTFHFEFASLSDMLPSATSPLQSFLFHEVGKIMLSLCLVGRFKN